MRMLQCAWDDDGGAKHVLRLLQPFGSDFMRRGPELDRY